MAKPIILDPAIKNELTALESMNLSGNPPSEIRKIAARYFFDNAVEKS